MTTATTPHLLQEAQEERERISFQEGSCRSRRKPKPSQIPEDEEGADNDATSPHEADMDEPDGTEPTAEQ